MSDLEKNIRTALATDEAELLRQFGEPTLSEQVIESFRGKSRWLVGPAVLAGIGWGVFAVFSAFQFFRAEEVRDMIAWAGGFLFGMIATAITKIWYWMELNKYVVMREIKRVELQIVQLSDRLEKR